MIKTATQIILMANLALMLVWVYHASRFTRLYNASTPHGNAPIRLVSVLFGSRAAGQGIHWLLTRGYCRQGLPGLIAAGDKLRRLTMIIGLFSFTIPVVALLWLNQM